MYALCFVDYHLRYYALFTTKNIFVIKKFIFSSIHDRKEEKKTAAAEWSERWKHVFLTWRHTTANKNRNVWRTKKKRMLRVCGWEEIWFIQTYMTINSAS